MKQQHTREIPIKIQRTSFDDIKTQATHHIWFDGTVMEFRLETEKAPLRFRKTLNEVEIKHSSGKVNQETESLKNLLFYGALATGAVMVIREPLPLFFIASAGVACGLLFLKPKARLIFDFVDEDTYIVAEVPSAAATELFA